MQIVWALTVAASLLLQRLGLGRNKLFCVRLVGRPAWFEMEGALVRYAGFLTTRFVLAPTPDDAVESARRIVYAESRKALKNPPEEPLQLDLEFCEQCHRTVFYRGGGFTFYEQE